MAPIYLFDIYKILDTRRAELHALQVSANPEDVETRWFLKGRENALMELRDFLKNGYEGKLPRRLQAKRGDGG